MMPFDRPLVSLAALLALSLAMAVDAPAQTAISAGGVVESTLGGFRFPDGSLQVSAARAPFVVVPDEFADIAAAIASLSAGGTVYVRAKSTCYELADMIHINRSNLSLLGEEGACLRLADHINRPAVLIGSSSETVPPSERIFDVAVSGFRIDGNRVNQDQEDAAGLPNVKNNAIGVRGAERVVLQRLTLANARSGGLVISQQASKVFVSGVVFSGNFFDGLAIDGASEILVERFVSEDNSFSGISIDTGSSRLQIRDGLVQRNGDNGIFIRFARESSFTDLTIADNCNHGVFASHDDAGVDRGLVEISFSGLRIFRNADVGFFFGTTQAEQSFDNFLTHSQVGGNGGSGEADETSGITFNAAIHTVGNAIVPFRVDGPTNRTCPGESSMPSRASQEDGAPQYRELFDPATAAQSTSGAHGPAATAPLDRRPGAVSLLLSNELWDRIIGTSRSG